MTTQYVTDLADAVRVFLATGEASMVPGKMEFPIAAVLTLSEMLGRVSSPHRKTHQYGRPRAVTTGRDDAPHRNARLTWPEVRAIRDAQNDPDVLPIDLAAKHRVTTQTIYYIWRRQTWWPDPETVPGPLKDAPTEVHPAQVAVATS